MPQQKIINTDKDDREIYSPDQDERDFLLQAYSDYLECRNIKNEPQPVIGGRTLKDFWDSSNYDYNVLVSDYDINDPVVPYASSISRDEANTFISNLALTTQIPSVTAQNEGQEIDQIMSKVGRSMLEWAYNNDGRPSESGHRKQFRYVHKMTVEGTVHVQDDIIDGELVSQLVPNEEMYIPNFFEPDTQKQPYIFRVKDNIVWEEAKSEFGDLPNFKFVHPGNPSNWDIGDESIFKSEYDGIVKDDRVEIIYIWYDIDKTDFKKHKVPLKRKKAKLFNIAINGVLMFKVNNLMPYKDGFYPINKGIFEHFSKPEYYWGNSMPNKASQDKKWLDGWKTLMRHKGKLSLIPPLLTFNGLHLDSDVYVPGQASLMPAGAKVEDITTIPGMSEGLKSSDFALFNEGKSDVISGSLSPQQSGKASAPKTAREAIILEANEQQIISSFALQLSFLQEARSLPILSRLFQFIPRQKIKKIAIPDQSLGEGKQGDLEIVFEKLVPMTEDEQMAKSREIREIEFEADKRGTPKKLVFINIEYIRNINLYVNAISDPTPKKTSALRRLEARDKFELYSAHPDVFNKKNSARILARELGDEEKEVIIDVAPAPNVPTPASATPSPIKNSGAQQTANLGELT